jgi:hypothetical protein
MRKDDIAKALVRVAMIVVTIGTHREGDRA